MVEVKYNIYLREQLYSWYLFALSERQMKRVVETYHLGKTKFTLSGKTQSFGEIREIRIFSMKLEIDHDTFKNKCASKGLLMSGLFNKNCFKPEAFLLLGEEVTDDIIGDSGFGEKGMALELIEEKLSTDFVDPKRIAEIQVIQCEKFDLSRLLVLCDEINVAYRSECVLSVGMLLRAIMDYVPPIFGFASFNELAHNYKDGGRSHGKLFKNLQNSFRNTADGYLHTQARKKDSIPLMKQVDYQSELDILLSEVVRILK